MLCLVSSTVRPCCPLRPGFHPSPIGRSVFWCPPNATLRGPFLKSCSTGINRIFCANDSFPSFVVALSRPIRCKNSPIKFTICRWKSHAFAVASDVSDARLRCHVVFSVLPSRSASTLYVVQNLLVDSGFCSNSGRDMSDRML